MTEVAVQVTGLNELRAALKQIADAGLKKELAQANKAAAEIVVQEARPRTPYRTGRLRASLKALGSQKIGRVRASAPYAGAIHWGRNVGNVGSPPGNHPGWNPIVGRPFLTDAVKATSGRIVDQYGNAIDELIKKAFP